MNKKRNKKLSYLHNVHISIAQFSSVVHFIYKVNAFWVRFAMAACRNISLEVLAVICDNQRQEFFAPLCANNFCYSIDKL